jgi:hypothetical protein
MTQKDKVFVTDVVIIDLMRETMVSSVISRPIGVVAELSVIAKIHKYRGLHGRHHFISMTMEVHDAPMCDMDRFMKECTYLSTIDDQDHLSFFFAFNFLGNMLILLFNMF